MKFAITKHSRERFAERFPQLVNDLSDRDVERLMISLLTHSSEERAYLNDSNFMARLYQKYGYATRYAFLMNDRVVFVCIVKDQNTRVVMTCYDALDRGGWFARAHLKKKRRAKHVIQTYPKPV